MKLADATRAERQTIGLDQQGRRRKYSVGGVFFA
jgi:hypothetical protein